ncbi:stalk domain-containing protein [Cohnella phaseoli]|uniref:Copper amine oxidase-like protein n=1 Tax=Cohnella phaseoli TaxID=456490 RepID=A0A3D9KH52_9BACL|nr:copper amine oxidase N-terminal domain-containing protein [Cohnella phaseoli]RED85188.1 copper amine oxidase-like protein [Cohnella phaseoli]
MKKFKGYIIGFLCGAVIFSATSVFAAETILKATQVSFPIFKDGKKASLDNKPVVINGSTYLPLRELAEVLDVDVAWKNDTKEIYLSTTDKSYQVQPKEQENNPTSTQMTTPTPSPSPTSAPTPTNPSLPNPSNNLNARIAETERHNQEVSKIETKYNNTKNYIDEKIAAIKSESPVGYFSDSEFESQRSQLQTEILNLQNQINTLMLDTSFEANSRRNSLQDQLNQKNKELEELQKKRTAQLRIKNLEDMKTTAYNDYLSELNAENNLHNANLNNLQ